MGEHVRDVAGLLCAECQLRRLILHAQVAQFERFLLEGCAEFPKSALNERITRRAIVAVRCLKCLVCRHHSRLVELRLLRLRLPLLNLLLN